MYVNKENCKYLRIKILNMISNNQTTSQRRNSGGYKTVGEYTY